MDTVFGIKLVEGQDVGDPQHGDGTPTVHIVAQGWMIEEHLRIEGCRRADFQEAMLARRRIELGLQSEAESPRRRCRRRRRRRRRGMGRSAGIPVVARGVQKSTAELMDHFRPDVFPDYTDRIQVVVRAGEDGGEDGGSTDSGAAIAQWTRDVFEPNDLLGVGGHSPPPALCDWFREGCWPRDVPVLPSMSAAAFFRAMQSLPSSEHTAVFPKDAATSSLVQLKTADATFSVARGTSGKPSSTCEASCATAAPSFLRRRGCSSATATPASAPSTASSFARRSMTRRTAGHGSCKRL